MSILIISSSLNPESNSRKLAQCAEHYAKKSDYTCEFVDLCDFPLPLCDGDAGFSDANVGKLSEKILAASCILLAGPIYTYGIAATTRNLIELTGKAWTGKPVGLLVAAGGTNSYMAVFGIANSLMLDYRCPIIPKYVYAIGTGFDGDVIDPGIETRIHELVDTTRRWGDVL